MSKSMLSTWDDLQQLGYQEQATGCSLGIWQSTKDLKIHEYVSYGIHAIKKKGGIQKNILLKILHTQNIYSLIKLND